MGNLHCPVDDVNPASPNIYYTTIIPRVLVHSPGGPDALLFRSLGLETISVMALGTEPRLNFSSALAPRLKWLRPYMGGFLFVAVLEVRALLLRSVFGSSDFVRLPDPESAPWCLVGNEGMSYRDGCGDYVKK